MKLIKSGLLLFVVCGLLAGSCKKTNHSPSVTASLSFKANGVAKSTNTITTNYSQSSNTLQLTAVLTNGEILSLAINNVKAGTFDVATGAAAVNYTVGSTAIDSYTGTTGNVTISSFTSSTVTGTFQFTGVNTASTSMAITEGAFQANHQ
jgi:hypothetical protein